MATLPGVYLGAAHYLGLLQLKLPHVLAAVIFGMAIVGGAFLLTWGAEAAQVDVSAGRALVVLTLLTVLPEYAVDFVFTYQAGQIYGEAGACVPIEGGVNPCSLALASMTGANRVLVGVGWPLVVLIGTWASLRHRRAGGAPDDDTLPGEVRLAPARSVEVVFLGIATLYSLTLPLRHTLTLVDAGVLVTIFALYAWRLRQAPAKKPELAGVAAWVGEQSHLRRRMLYLTFCAWAGLVILVTVQRFSEALVSTALALRIEEFQFVQWLAPLASESPELIVACLYALWLAASPSLTSLLVSKFNQWTLLVGAMPVVFALSAGTTNGLPLDSHQRLELLLTAAQSLFAVSILVTLSLTVYGAVGLLSLFSVQ
ncbi:MAG: sodium:proton exchanger, partial [Pseudonocardiaceae bacterium]